MKKTILFIMFVLLLTIPVSVLGFGSGCFLTGSQIQGEQKLCFYRCFGGGGQTTAVDKNEMCPFEL